MHVRTFVGRYKRAAFSQAQHSTAFSFKRYLKQVKISTFIMNRRGRGGNAARFQPYPGRPTRNYDQCCQHCGTLIRNCAHLRPDQCDSCRAPQDGKRGWRPDGWGRCPDCYQWVHNTEHLYCTCGFGNAEALERSRRIAEAARQQEEFRRNQELARLRQELEQSRREAMELQRQIDDRAEGEMMRLADVVINDQDDLGPGNE